MRQFRLVVMLAVAMMSTERCLAFAPASFWTLDETAEEADVIFKGTVL